MDEGFTFFLAVRKGWENGPLYLVKHLTSPILRHDSSLSKMNEIVA